MIDETEFRLSGDPAQAWNVSFSGSFTGTVEITFSYDPDLLTVHEYELLIYHNDQGVWTELPVVGRDSFANTITVTTTSFSLFVLGADPNPPPIPATSDWGLATLALLVITAGTLAILHRRYVVA